MTQYPKITIITPSFNQGQFIEQTIRSVIEQNYPNLEYIIIDGGSTDNTVEIIKKYEKYLTYWISEPDKGQAHAINKGLQKATGEIFNWINSDDYYEPRALFKIAKSFVLNKNAHIVAGKERAFDSNTGKTVEIYEGTKIQGDLYDLIYQGIIDQPPTFWRMDIVKHLGKLPEQLHFTMDSYWWTKYLLMYGVQYVVKIYNVLTNFRLHEKSKTVSVQSQFNSNRFAIRLAVAKELRFDEAIVSYLQEQTNIFLETFFENIKLLPNFSSNKLQANFALHIYPRYYMTKDYANAIKCFNLAFEHYKTKQNIIDYVKLKIVPQKIIELFRKK